MDAGPRREPEARGERAGLAGKSGGGTAGAFRALAAVGDFVRRGRAGLDVLPGLGGVAGVFCDCFDDFMKPVGIRRSASRQAN
jgi:hypothetical protein